MRKEYWFYISFGLIFVLYVVFEFYRPKPLNWTPTYKPSDKNPYGGYVMYDRFDDFFPEKEMSYNSLYELQDSLKNLIIISNYIELDELDQEILLDQVDSGYSVLIAASHFSKNFLDTLELEYDFTFVESIQMDTLEINMGEEVIKYPKDLFSGTEFSIANDSIWTTHASQSGAPILVSRNWGKGKLILCSTPLLFTNYSILENETFAEKGLNLLSQKPVHYTLFYHLGKPQNQSPFRYIVSEEALRWALYLSIAATIILLIFNSQRRQRPIPVITPLANTTISFVKTIGALAYREKNNKNTAEKLIQHLFHQLHKRFFVKPIFEEKYYQFLAQKTGTDKADVIQVFETIQFIQKQHGISEDLLKKFYQKLNSLNLH